MTDQEKRNLIRTQAIKIGLILFDAISAGISYFAALVIRFYVSHNFTEVGLKYLPAYIRFIPYYTVCVVIVFYLFHMYSMTWRYMGFNDLKHIIYANICTCVIQVAGSILFVRRMPITYYAIGAVIQFSLVSIIRFIPLMFYNEVFFDKRNVDAIRCMIVGMGNNARMLQDRLERDPAGKERAVCILDPRSGEGKNHRFFNGLPVLHGIDNINDYIEKNSIGCVYITERMLSEAIREKIVSACELSGADIQDFVIGTDRTYGKVRFSELMKVTHGKVIVKEGNREHSFNNPQRAGESIGGSAFIKDINAGDSALTVSIERDDRAIDDKKTEWIKRYEQENGEEVTFF